MGPAKATAGTIVLSTVSHMYATFTSAPVGRSDCLGACNSDSLDRPSVASAPVLGAQLCRGSVCMAHQLVPVHLKRLWRPQPQADDGETVGHRHYQSTCRSKAMSGVDETT